MTESITTAEAGSCRILVIDDEEDIRVVLERFLTSKGHRVQTASNAREAINRMGSERFDLVLTDIRMPGMDGIDLAGWTKTNAPDSDIIIMTGHASVETAAQAMRLGAFDYMLKPFPTLDLVATTIDRAIERQRLRKQLQQTTEALRKSRDDFSSIVEKSTDGVLLVDSRNIIRFVNPSASTMLGESQPALLGKPFDRPLVPGQIDKLDITRLSGLPGVAEMSVQQTDWEGEDAYLLLLRDETVNKRHQERIERLNSLLRAIRNVNQFIVRERNRHRLAQRVCDELVKTRGYFRASIVLLDQTGAHSSTAESFSRDAFKADGQIPEMPHCVQTALARPGLVCIEDTSATCGECALAGRRADSGAMAIRLEYDGRIFGILVVALPSRFVTDREEHALLVEITEDIALALRNLKMDEKRQQAEYALKQAESRYEALFTRSLELVYVHDFAGQFLDANDRALAALGYEREEIPKIGFEDLLDPADLPRAMSSAQKIYQEGVDPDIHTFRLRRKDGSYIWIETTGVRLDSGRGPSCVMGIARDITQRRKLEQQVHGSQRMEAVGRLAGGIAHDFNNILTVISNYGGFLMDAFKDGDPAREDLNEIVNAAKRASKLNKQLLAFSRRQPAQPTVIDLNAVVQDIDRMLRRAIGEDVDLVLLLDENLGAVRADSGQLEQVLMNLGVNARDAMPKGGRLTIETKNAVLDQSYFDQRSIDMTPGEYVMLAVTDNGVGMDPETKAHAFEPFYTTKEEGKGTGLGLSSVYGIVKQNRGCVWVYSELGLGTTFKIYLPRVREAVDRKSRVSSRLVYPVGTETILLTEDDKSVRRAAARILHKAGYNVLEAESEGDALLIAEQHPGPIHVILTDVVMPRMSGQKLADRLSSIHRDMKVLFMSGYTHDAVVHRGVLVEGTAFVEKPFTEEELLTKLRWVLDS